MRLRHLTNPTPSAITGLLGWGIGLGGTLVYLLTLEPTISFWDCGEFVATSYKLEVGHPPGAPVYQLLAHCMMLLAGSHVERLAWWSNVLSAVAGGLTAMFLFWTLVRLLAVKHKRLENGQVRLWRVWVAAAVGSACYLFCDTAWFSAAESEVYSLSMLFSAVIIWAMVCWWCEQRCENPLLWSQKRYGARWMVLISLLLGLSMGVHQLSLLTLPMLILCYCFGRKQHVGKQQASDASRKRRLETAVLCAVFFLIGLTPFSVLAIRASANPPINQGNPSTVAAFKDYVSRAQYEKAPLLYGRCFNSPVVGYEDGKAVYAKEMNMVFPRMWRAGAHAEEYYCDWTGRHGKMVSVGGKQYYKPSALDNLTCFFAYQLGYMYLRYLMWNFAGRYNDQQGFGSLMKGQLITGIPPLDRQYVGTAAHLPDSMCRTGHHRYFLLPFILGIVGLFHQLRNDKQQFWAVLTLFLTTSVLLLVYLNHPMYEPRERDYAYVLSFYAFALWIGFGAHSVLLQRKKSQSGQGGKKVAANVCKVLIVMFVPVLMACQNWSDHDRSGRYMARDMAWNMLQSCESNAVLFTYGDNDTFPLWYLQEVEGVRTDVQVVNISLLGTDDYAESCKQQTARAGQDLLPGNVWRTMGPYRRTQMMLTANDWQRPVYYSRYGYDAYREHFEGRFQLTGLVYRLNSTWSDSVDVDACYGLMTNKLQWQSVEGVYLDETCMHFYEDYWRNAVRVADRLVGQGETEKALEVLETTDKMLPSSRLYDIRLRYAVLCSYRSVAATSRQEDALRKTTEQEIQLRNAIRQQLDYYATMKPSMLQYIPYTLEPLLEVGAALGML